VGLRDCLYILGKKRILALAMIRTFDCPGYGQVAVSTHNCCERRACCVSHDDHIVLAVKRHVEEIAKKFDWFSFAFFKWPFIHSIIHSFLYFP
jgi:hypothetical protein